MLSLANERTWRALPGEAWSTCALLMLYFERVKRAACFIRRIGKAARRSERAMDDARQRGELLVCIVSALVVS